MKKQPDNFADFEPLALRGLYLGVGPNNRGKYFVLRPSGMVPLVAKVNTPEMHEELKGSVFYEPAAGVHEEMQDALVAALTRAKRRDRTRGRETEVTLPDLIAIFSGQNGVCALTGMPFSVSTGRAHGEGRGPWSPSIDRIDNSQGYTRGNVRIVTVMANLAKAEFSDADFFRMCAETSVNKGLVAICLK